MFNLIMCVLIDTKVMKLLYSHLFDNQTRHNIYFPKGKTMNHKQSVRKNVHGTVKFIITIIPNWNICLKFFRNLKVLFNLNMEVTANYKLSATTRSVIT